MSTLIYVVIYQWLLPTSQRILMSEFSYEFFTEGNIKKSGRDIGNTFSRSPANHRVTSRNIEVVSGGNVHRKTEENCLSVLAAVN